MIQIGSTAHSYCLCFETIRIAAWEQLLKDDGGGCTFNGVLTLSTWEWTFGLVESRKTQVYLITVLSSIKCPSNGDSEPTHTL